MTDDEIALAEDQMVDLQTLIPPKPELEKVEAMLEAALTGTSYAEAEDKSDSAAISSMVSKAKPASSMSEKLDQEVSVVAEDVEVAAAVGASSYEEFDDEADKILAQIHARRKDKA